MTLVGVFGILFGLSSVLLAFIHATRLRVAVFAGAYLMHVGMAILYYQFVSGSGGDAWLYYANPYGVTAADLEPGTVFVIYITQLVKVPFGGTYFDFFLLFQAIGFFGIVCLMRIFEEIFENVGLEQPGYIYLLLFIPGLHYWSSAVGKDSLFFFATAVSLWASLRLKERLPAMIVGLLLMLAIRPHIAVVAMAALAVTVVSDRSTSGPVRLLLFVGALIGTAFSVSTVWSTFQIDLTRADAISDHLAGREALVQTEAAGRTMVDLIYPLRVLSLMFRPFFFDAGGALGLVVSLENAALVPIIGMLLWKRKTARALFKAVPFARYALVSSVGVLLVLSLGYYNVGLGIRQKATMILPGFLVFFVALVAVLRARRESSTPVALSPIDRRVPA
jgi:hypothetical protein